MSPPLLLTCRRGCSPSASTSRAAGTSHDLPTLATLQECSPPCGFTERGRAGGGGGATRT